MFILPQGENLPLRYRKRPPSHLALSTLVLYGYGKLLVNEKPCRRNRKKKRLAIFCLNHHLRFNLSPIGGVNACQPITCFMQSVINRHPSGFRQKIIRIDGK